MLRRVSIVLISLLAITSCTLAGMDHIAGYETIAMVVAIAACFIMALGFAVSEKMHKQYIEEGRPRWRAWMFFALILVVFIFMLTCA